LDSASNVIADRDGSTIFQPLGKKKSVSYDDKINDDDDSSLD
jgi:hypothetical protein